MTDTDSIPLDADYTLFLPVYLLLDAGHPASLSVRTADVEGDEVLPLFTDRDLASRYAGGTGPDSVLVTAVESAPLLLALLRDHSAVPDVAIDPDADGRRGLVLPLWAVVAAAEAA